MKLTIAAGFASILLAGVISTASAQKDLYEDDLYGSPKKNSTKVSKTSSASSLSSNSSSSSYKYTMSSSKNSDKLGDLVDTYDEALTRRIDAYQSDKAYTEDYWDVQEKFVGYLSKKYDKDLYNVIVINDKVWVEPSYITALFDDSDPAAGINNYVKGFKDGLKANNTSTVNVVVNVVDPWYSSWSWNPWRWGSYYYPYYRPYHWDYPYWGGGYYPHYRPHWDYPYWGGGGYYRPYNGSSRSNGYYTGARNQYYERGSAFGRREYSSSNKQNTTSGYNRDNVRVYDFNNRRSNSSVTNRPSQSTGGSVTNYNRVERSGDNFRRIDPSRTNNYNRVDTNKEQKRPSTFERREPVSRPSYTPPPVSRPSYTPPAGRSNGGGDGGGSFGGGGGGGVVRRR